MAASVLWKLYWAVVLGECCCATVAVQWKARPQRGKEKNAAAVCDEILFNFGCGKQIPRPQEVKR